MQRICLFPGTFDPVTLGHTDIINRALPLFDKVVVGIGINAAKNPMFTADQRKLWFEEIYHNEPKLSVKVNKRDLQNTLKAVSPEAKDKRTL